MKGDVCATQSGRCNSHPADRMSYKLPDGIAPKALSDCGSKAAALVLGNPLPPSGGASELEKGKAVPPGRDRPPKALRAGRRVAPTLGFMYATRASRCESPPEDCFPRWRNVSYSHNIGMTKQGETAVEMYTDKCGGSYWNSLAGSYGGLQPPLVPSRDDLRFFEDTAAAWAAGHPGVPVQALLLGVTPRIAGMRWPAPSVLVAVDGSPAMVRQVWPGNIEGVRWGVCGDWLALPLKDSSCQLVIGDGSINCVSMPYPEGFHRAAKSLYRVLDDEGLLILRCYLLPDAPESPEDVFKVTYQSPAPPFHDFKFRLLMALQPSTREGLLVGDVYRYWAGLNVDTARLAARTGWDPAAIEMMGLYRGAQTQYTFPTRKEFQTVFGELFEEVTCWTPPHDLGPRCPAFVLRRRGPHEFRGAAK